MNKVIGWGAVLSLLAAPLCANAAFVTYEFRIPSGPEGALSPEMQDLCPEYPWCWISGTFTFDSEAVGTPWDSGVPGRAGVTYDSAVVGFDIEFWNGSRIQGNPGPGESFLSLSTDVIVSDFSFGVRGQPFTFAWHGGVDLLPRTLTELLGYDDWMILRGEFAIAWFDLTGTGSDLWAVQQFRKVPEPATLVLLGLGLVGMGYARRRKAA